jgi:hypothetical protein
VTGDNQGVIIGDNVRVEAPIAGGRNARATMVTVGGGVDAQRQELWNRLDALAAALASAVTSGALNSEVQDTAEEVREQLSRERPNKLTLGSLLQGIVSAAGSVETVSAAAKAVYGLVMSIF